MFTCCWWCQLLAIWSRAGCRGRGTSCRDPLGTALHRQRQPLQKARACDTGPGLSALGAEFKQTPRKPPQHPTVCVSSWPLPWPKCRCLAWASWQSCRAFLLWSVHCGLCCFPCICPRNTLLSDIWLNLELQRMVQEWSTRKDKGSARTQGRDVILGQLSSLEEVRFGSCGYLTRPCCGTIPFAAHCTYIKLSVGTGSL